MKQKDESFALVLHKISGPWSDGRGVSSLCGPVLHEHATQILQHLLVARLQDETIDQV